MAMTRRTRWSAALLALVALVGLATPANATVTATYGTLTAGAPSVAACTGGTCMATSAVVASNGTVATVITVTVKLYRTKAAGGTTASPSTDVLLKTVTSTYSSTKSLKQSWTLAASQKCLTVATSLYGYYTRVTMTNGTVSGTVTENSAVKQLKGCLSV
jgi:hypothetical protein